MPVFDYECKKCDRVDEIVQYIIADKETYKCPDCGEKMERMLSAPGLLKTNFHDKPSVKRR